MLATLRELRRGVSGSERPLPDSRRPSKAGQSKEPKDLSKLELHANARRRGTGGSTAAYSPAAAAAAAAAGAASEPDAELDGGGVVGSVSEVPKCTILHYSPFKAVWDWVILLLVLYTAVSTPYTVAFLVNETEARMKLNTDSATRLRNAGINQADPLVIIDLLVDIMFIVDIIINFRTTYVHDGEVVSDPRKIAVNYFKGWFVIDTVAALPFDLLFFGSGTTDTLTVTGVLKLARLLRLLRVARRLDHYSQYATALLLLLIIIYALIGHWFACIFYAIANVERQSLEQPITWLDDLANKMQKPYVKNDTLSGPDLSSRYITAYFFVLTTLTSIGFGNVAPVTNMEKIFSIVAMMVGALLNAAVFGNFSTIMLRMYQGSEELQQKTQSIKDFIQFHDIPRSLSKRIQEAFQHSWSYTNGVDMNSVLKSFPEQIQADICLHLNKNLLSNNSAFSGASPGCLRALSLRFTTTHAPPGDTLLHSGDTVTCVYFIARGTIEILKDDISMAILGRGDIFGVGVDSKNSTAKSNYSVRALTYCDLNKIDAADLHDIFDMYPEFTGNFKHTFLLSFNLQLGEYRALVNPSDLDKETIKLIRQNRPRMQCRVGSVPPPLAGAGQKDDGKDATASALGTAGDRHSKAAVELAPPTFPQTHERKVPNSLAICPGPNAKPELDGSTTRVNASKAASSDTTGAKVQSPWAALLASAKGLNSAPAKDGAKQDRPAPIDDFDKGSYASGRVGGLRDIDQRLSTLSWRLGKFEDELTITVDSILKILLTDSNQQTCVDVTELVTLE